MIPDDCLGYARCLVEVTEVRPEVLVLVQILLVAFERCMGRLHRNGSTSGTSARLQVSVGHRRDTAGQRGLRPSNQARQTRL